MPELIGSHQLVSFQIIVVSPKQTIGQIKTILIIYSIYRVIHREISPPLFTLIIQLFLIFGILYDSNTVFF